ncbi:tyrosine-type recombinase/integrase [Pollutimonas sp. M17]|uniref:tyrosine-type recombinase/integrase n=1 Tax=Pollutimonas sp. M17 TaxID=2962065 RepID=UPI0021F4D8D7|nr:integrase family protein [Pollutimonas sp. M17]UYO95036.1 integrase family protein [Pollutimonas sp. M17]
MAKVKLTAGRIQAFTCPPDKRQAFLWDADVNGLAVRATAGAKAYIYQGRLKGKSLRMTIGDVSVWSLEEYRHPKTGEVITPGARPEARRLQAIIDQGRDPREVKAELTVADVAKRTKAKQEEAPALDAWNVYIAARAPKWSERHKADHENMARDGGEKITRGRRKGMPEKKEPGILRPLLDLPLSQITRDAVADWLEQEAPKRPTRTRLALSLLATFINWCSDRPEYREQVNADACVRLKRELPKAQAKDDCLQREQLALWFEHVRKIGSPVISAYLQTALLTGARREEIAALRWEDVDFQWDSLQIADKVERETGRVIPLTPYVKSLLLELRRVNNTPTVRQLRSKEAEDKPWTPSPWVFSSPTAEAGYIAEPRIAHNKAIQAAGLPHLTIHGLRRSFGTLAEWVECPAGVVAQIQGHKPSAIAEKHYRRRPLDLLRMWHTKIEGWILKQAGIEQPTEQAQPLKAINAA